MDDMIKVSCPMCGGELWIDPASHTVIQHKKSEKRVLSSFEELLENESRKKQKTDERFLQAKKLEETKKKKAAEIFEQSMKDETTHQEG
jgi:hypothetical protein